MEAKDIQAGQEYARQRTPHGQVQHVRTVEPCPLQVVINGPVHQGWRVEHVDGWQKGRRSVVLNRELISTWADHEKRTT